MLGNKAVERLNDPRTLRVLSLIIDRPRTAKGIAAELEVEKGNLYRNLRDLELLGLIYPGKCHPDECKSNRSHGAAYYPNVRKLEIRISPLAVSYIAHYLDGTVEEVSR
ncbi:MAG: helix-turn-helix domain-containing protein [Methanomassiliicoccales archaeon]|jgi:hypothetical protein